MSTTEHPYSDLLEITNKPEKPRRRWPLRVGIGVLVALLIGASVFAFLQYKATVKVAGERDTQHSRLLDTRKELESAKADEAEARSQVSGLESDLTDAEDTVALCQVASTVGTEMFEATGSLLQYLTKVLDDDYSDSGLDDAGDNVDTATKILHDNGYETWEDLAAACSGDAGETA